MLQAHSTLNARLLVRGIQEVIGLWMSTTSKKPHCYPNERNNLARDRNVENFRMWIWGDNYKTDEVEKANKVLNKLEKDQIKLLEDLMHSCLDNNVNYTITMNLWGDIDES